ncbi:MAG: ferritin-like domain-containing protein [Cyclobacteriaceae bacterium]
MKKLREKHEYDGNPVGLSKETCKTIAEDLDRHLATYFLLYQQYHKHHWLVEGPQFRDLHLFFEEHYNEVHKHYDALAERLTVLGYAPTCNPVNMAELSYIEFEEEGVFHIRDMLKKDMADEKSISIELRKSIKIAFDLSDFATKRLLEKLLDHAEERAHHIEHFLGEDSLVIGLLHKEKELENA